MDQQLDAASAELLLQIVNHAPDGVIVIDNRGVVVLCNQTVCELSGYSAEELMGQNVDRLVPAPQRDSHGTLRAAFVREGGARPMGLGRALSLARRVSGGVFAVAAIRDVTERLRTEEELRQVSDLLMVAHERERIARDLHDTVLQRLFGLGLDLQALEMQAPTAITGRITNAVDEIDRVVREIRTLVFTLGAAYREGSFGQELGAVIAQASRLLGFTPHARVQGPVEAAVPTPVRVEMMATLREALSNAARHAHATSVDVEIAAGDELTLTVTDNGSGLPVGFDPDRGNGLQNMRERARLLGGTFSVRTRSVGGTEVRWQAPLPD
jgi:two-component system, NarL family, sensor histidine kinase DevS